jgi:hypothetical protein
MKGTVLCFRLVKPWGGGAVSAAEFRLRFLVRRIIVKSYPFQERISRLTFIVLCQNLRRSGGGPVKWANPPMRGGAVPTSIADLT